MFVCALQGANNPRALAMDRAQQQFQALGVVTTLPHASSRVNVVVRNDWSDCFSDETDVCCCSMLQ